MDLLHLVDRLEELVGSAQKMPIGSRIIIDRRRLLDVVDQMRVVIPQEVREARDMVERRDELRRESEEEARMIVARAEEQAARLIEDHAVTVAAREHAEREAAEARARLEERISEANGDVQRRLEESRRLANEQMTEADSYSTELLQRLETQLEAFVRSVRVGLSQLERAEAEGEAEATDSASAAPPSPLEEAAPAELVEPIEAPQSAPVVPLATVVGLEPATPEPPVSIHASERAGLGATDKLKNLLGRSPSNGGAVRVEEGVAVIDDFAHPPLDDEGDRRD